MIYTIILGVLSIGLTIAYVMTMLDLRDMREAFKRINNTVYVNECKINGFGAVLQKEHEDMEKALEKQNEFVKVSIGAEKTKGKKEAEKKDLWIMSMLTYMTLMRDKAHSLHIDFAKTSEKDLVKLIELSIQADAGQITWQEAAKKCKELGISMEVK
jgi:hypothetical protein